MPVPSHSLFSSVKLLLRVADGPILPGPVRCRAGPSCQGLFLGDQEPVLRPGLLMPPVVWTGPRFSPQVSAVSWCPRSPGLSSSLFTSPSHCRPPGISATHPPLLLPIFLTAAPAHLQAKTQASPLTLLFPPPPHLHLWHRVGSVLKTCPKPVTVPISVSTPALALAWRSQEPPDRPVCLSPCPLQFCFHTAAGDKSQ